MEDLVVTSTDIDANNQINSESPLQDKETALKRKHESDDNSDSKVPKTELNSDDDENDDGAFCTIVSIFILKDMGRAIKSGGNTNFYQGLAQC